MANVQLIPFKLEGMNSNIFEVPAGVRMIRASSFWTLGYRGENAVVAVIDTGCQTNHPDLRGQVIGGRNFTADYNGNPDNYSDNNGHGTHVAGIIAAAENGFGVVGVAPKAKLLVLKALNGQGTGTIKSITEAVDYAVNWTGPNGEKVRVISMSLGGPDDDQALHTAIQNAVQHNILVVCAAGNQGDGSAQTTETSYPGAYEEVVEVGAVNQSRRVSTFSNSNSQVDLVAPGEYVISTMPKFLYGIMSGTSMAAPHVAGAAALLIDRFEKKHNRPITEPELFQELIAHTLPLGYPRSQEGNGLLRLNEVQRQKMRSLLIDILRQSAGQ